MKQISLRITFLIAIAISTSCNSGSQNQATINDNEKTESNSQVKSDYFEGYWVSESNNPSFNIKITKVSEGVYDGKILMGTMEVSGWSGHWHTDPTLGDKTIVHTDTENAKQEFALTYTDNGKLYNGKFFFIRKN